MTNNKLRVKADKIDFIIIGTSRQRSKLGSSLRPSLIVASHHQTLYVILDFNFRKHIRDLRRIHRYISLSVAKTIPIALVTSRLDNWNSLLYNIASKDILKLECVQNCLARVVTRSPRFSHSVPLLKSLHRTWFPVQSRIILNSALFPIKLFFSGEPSYLFFMLLFYHRSPENSFHLASTCCLLSELKFMLFRRLFQVFMSTSITLRSDM